LRQERAGPRTAAANERSRLLYGEERAVGNDGAATVPYLYRRHTGDVYSPKPAPMKAPTTDRPARLRECGMLHPGAS